MFGRTQHADAFGKTLNENFALFERCLIVAIYPNDAVSRSHVDFNKMCFAWEALSPFIQALERPLFHFLGVVNSLVNRGFSSHLRGFVLRPEPLAESLFSDIV